VLNDAISIYFAEATLASAFVARWCVGAKVETAGGVFRVREDEPEPQVGAAQDAVSAGTPDGMPSGRPWSSGSRSASTAAWSGGLFQRFDEMAYSEPVM
jgi:hypothetical protein